MSNLDLIIKIKALIDPDRPGGVSRFELYQAQELLGDLFAREVLNRPAVTLSAPRPDNGTWEEDEE